MTDAEFNAWLASPASIRCLLVEAVALVDGVETTRYLSSAGYVTGAGDTPANTVYLPLVLGGVKFAETLSLDAAGLSYGDVELDNTDGSLDLWLNDLWRNKPIKMYTGDVRWPRADFRMVFNGVIDDIATKSRTRVNLKLRDKMQRLNTPVTEVKVGGTSQSKDMLVPLVFGEVHNMLPVLIDPALHTYQVHQGPIRKVIEVRDNGAPVAATIDVMEGKFSLSGSPAGMITASVQGDILPSWSLTTAAIVRRLSTAYGKETDRLTDADIDSANFDAFDAANPQPVGICSMDRRNVLDMCQAVARTVGAQLFFNRLGLLQLLKLQFPGTGTPVLIESRDMLAQNLTVAARSEVVASVKIGYCKNWQVQTNLQTGIIEESKVRFATEWDNVTARYASVADAYNIDVEPVQRDTMFLRRIEAEPEAWRLLDILSVPRTTYRFEGLGRMLTLQLGQAVLLKHHRFGLDAIEEGTPGVVVGLTPDWINGRCTVEVMV